MQASSLTHLWTSANKMIYFTFFHSLFWLNTMEREKERERGEELQFLLFRGLRHSVIWKSYSTCVPKQKKCSQVCPLFRWPLTFLEEGTAVVISSMAQGWSFPESEQDPCRDCPLVCLQSCPNLGTPMISKTSFLWAFVSGSIWW